MLMITGIMLAITYLGNWETILFLNIGVGIVLIKNKRGKYLAALVISSLSELAIVEPLKRWAAEARPTDGMVAVNGFSFPSGHSYTAMAVYGLLTYFLLKYFRKKWQKYLSLSIGIILISMIAYSRIYLRVHWPSDVIGGIFLGGCWLWGTIKILEK